MAEDPSTETTDQLPQDTSDYEKMKSRRLEIAEVVNSVLSIVKFLPLGMKLRTKLQTEEENKPEKVYYKFIADISKKLENLDSLVKENEELAIGNIQEAAGIIEECFKPFKKIPKTMTIGKTIAGRLEKLIELLKRQDESDDSAESDSGDDDPSAKRIKPMEESF
ncbi:unnamed protein product [Caenorhabditis nigoni]